MDDSYRIVVWQINRQAQTLSLGVLRIFYSLLEAISLYFTFAKWFGLEKPRTLINIPLAYDDI